MIIDQPGRDLEASLNWLSDAEKQASPHIALPSEPRRFVVQKYWLVEETALRRALLEKVRLRPPLVTRQLPRLKRFSVRSLLVADATGRRVAAASGASLVRVRKNIRGFYLAPHPMTLKVNNIGVDPGGLINEIDFRSRLQEVAPATAPRLRFAERGQQRTIILEELIPAHALRVKRVKADILKQVIDKVVASYESCGTKLRPVVEFLEEVSLNERLRVALEMLEANGLSVDRGNIDTVLSNLTAEEDRLIQLVQGHGDLSLHNVLIDHDGEIYLCDWEYAAETTLPGDFSKLLNTYPYARALIHDAFRSLASEDERARMVSFSEHHDIGCILLAFKRMEALQRIDNNIGPSTEKIARKYLSSIYGRLSSVGRYKNDTLEHHQ